MQNSFLKSRGLGCSPSIHFQVLQSKQPGHISDDDDIAAAASGSQPGLHTRSLSTHLSFLTCQRPLSVLSFLTRLQKCYWTTVHTYENSVQDGSLEFRRSAWPREGKSVCQVDQCFCNEIHLLWGHQNLILRF